MPMPMFPLGSVLFPGAVLTLQVFETRYREMVADVSAGDGRFGVVLINRGHEVGGGDQRTDVGTLAEIVRKAESEDGRILMMAVGRERIRVVEWLEDAPYPSAEVVVLPEGDVGPHFAVALEQARVARNQLLALAIEMGADGQNLQLDLPDAPNAAAWSLCDAAPVGPFDRQRLLETAAATERLHLLEGMMRAQTSDLEEVLRRG